MSRYITENERYIIETMLKDGYEPKDIAKRIGKHYTTIYREIKLGTVVFRNGRDWTNYRQYCADVAQRRHNENQTAKGTELKIGNHYALAEAIEHLVRDKKYSPYAVSVYLKKHKDMYPCTLSKGTLYNYIKRGLFLGITDKDLPQKGIKRKRYHAIKRKSYQNMRGKSIDERPTLIDKRQEWGHWEMDTVVSGTGKSRECLLVLTERQWRDEQIIKIKGKTTADVVAALDTLEKTIGYDHFVKRYKTITMDNGCEFLDGKGIEMSCTQKGKKRTTVYYCHPYSSWERGSNENQNKLIRRWFPKGCDLSKYSDCYVKYVENWINSYPREMYDGLSVEEVRVN